MRQGEEVSARLQTSPHEPKDESKRHDRVLRTASRRSRSNSYSGSGTSPQKANDNAISLYKTEPCQSFSESGVCRYGAKCRFAHGMEEIRPLARHKKYKTERCKTYAKDGFCPYGSRCRFVHEESEREAARAESPSAHSVSRNSPFASANSPPAASPYAGHTPSSSPKLLEPGSMREYEQTFGGSPLPPLPPQPSPPPVSPFPSARASPPPVSPFPSIRASASPALTPIGTPLTKPTNETIERKAFDVYHFMSLNNEEPLPKRPAEVVDNPHSLFSSEGPSGPFPSPLHEAVESKESQLPGVAALREHNSPLMVGEKERPFLPLGPLGPVPPRSSSVPGRYSPIITPVPTKRAISLSVGHYPVENPDDPPGLKMPSSILGSMHTGRQLQPEGGTRSLRQTQMEHMLFPPSRSLSFGAQEREDELGEMRQEVRHEQCHEQRHGPPPGFGPIEDAMRHAHARPASQPKQFFPPPEFPRSVRSGDFDSSSDLGTNSQESQTSSQEDAEIAGCSSILSHLELYNDTVPDPVPSPLFISLPRTPSPNFASRPPKHPNQSSFYGDDGSGRGGEGGMGEVKMEEMSMSISVHEAVKKSPVKSPNRTAMPKPAGSPEAVHRVRARAATLSPNHTYSRTPLVLKASPSSTSTRPRFTSPPLTASAAPFSPPSATLSPLPSASSTTTVVYHVSPDMNGPVPTTTVVSPSPSPSSMSPARSPARSPGLSPVTPPFRPSSSRPPTHSGSHSGSHSGFRKKN